MDIEVTQGEKKTATFTYEDSLDVSGATLSFAMKTDLDVSAAAVTKGDNSFDKANAATGIVSFDLNDTDTANAGTFIGEIKAIFSVTSLDRTDPITIWIKEKVGA